MDILEKNIEEVLTRTEENQEEEEEIPARWALRGTELNVYL